MTHIDLAFTLTAARAIPADHGYALYGAISRILPEVHRDNGIAVHPIPQRRQALSTAITAATSPTSGR